MTQRGVVGVRWFVLYIFFGQRFGWDFALATAGVAKLVMGDAEQPGGEGGFAAETCERFVGDNECFLSEIVGPRMIAAGELTQKSANGRLMQVHQFAESGPVVFNDNAGDKLEVGRAHAWGGCGDVGFSELLRSSR